MDIEKTAKKIKALLVKMAKEDKLPTDMNNLPLDGIIKILSKNTERTQLEKAGQYLCAGSDEEIELMIKLINEHEDENELIDYIDGVEVWEKVEYSFTCKQFMQEIS